MIKIKRFTLSYGNSTIIEDLNLQIKKGSFTAIIGESGTGKTSLALSLMGMKEGVVSGEIIVDSENILEYSEEKSREYRWNKISMVFQNCGEVLNPTVKIIEQVKETMIDHDKYCEKEAKKRASNLLIDSGLLEEYHYYYPAQLSGGQVQKVLVAMALANEPEIIIFDEPTSALDPLSKIEMVNLIKKIAKNRTVLLITHEFSIAERLAEEIIVLYGGRIVEAGAKDKILKWPLHPYTRGLLRSYPNMSTTKDLQGIRGVIKIEKNSCPFANRCTQKLRICTEKMPQLQEVKGRMVACHRKGIVCLLKGEKITKAYGKNRVLENIEFELLEGETLAVIGESGSGKTTLAKCIMGLEKIDGGGLYFFDRELIKHDRAFYEMAQIVYQNPETSINRNFNIFEALKEPLDILNIGSEEEKKELVRKSLKDVYLPYDKSFLEKYPYELSGGECQRVAIARALILNPKLIIADEVTSALDVSVQAKIMNLFLNLQEKRGLTLLFITHDIALARKISDKIIVMKNGRIIEKGISADIISSPKSEYAKKLIDAGPKIF